MDWEAIEANGDGPYFRTEDIANETAVVMPEIMSAFSYACQMEDASRDMSSPKEEELMEEHRVGLSLHTSAWPTEKEKGPEVWIEPEDEPPVNPLGVAVVQRVAQMEERPREEVAASEAEATGEGNCCS